MKVLLVSAALVAAALCAAPAPPPGWTSSGRLLLVPARLEAHPPPAEYPQTTAQPETNGTGVARESESDESQSAKLIESGEYYVLLPDGRLQMVKYATAAIKEEAAGEDSKAKEQTQENGAEPKYQFQHAYYIQAQEEQKEQTAQYNAQGPYKFQPAYYVQAQQEQKEQKEQTAQYNAQGPYKFQPAYYVQAQKEEQPAQYNAPSFQQQKFQPAAYPVFIRPTQESESSQYNAAENFQQKSDSKFEQVKQEPNLQIDFVQFPLQGSQQFSQTKLQLSEVKSAETKAEEKEEESGFEANLQYRDVKPISAPIYAYNPAPLVRILKK